MQTMPKGYRLLITSVAQLKEELLKRTDCSGGKDSCWNWKLSCNKGYGQFNYGGMKNVCRLIWEATYGSIPNGMHVLHHCDNRKCLNPTHLFLGTNGDNVKDKVSKNRQIKGRDIQSALLTEDEVTYIRTRYIPYSKNPNTSGKGLAEKFGVNINTIYDVTRGTTWKHVG